MAALCSAVMAYFLMTPVFSFRVSQPVDLAALVLYNSLGVVLALTQSKKKQIDLRSQYMKMCAEPRVEVDVQTALADILSTHVGAFLRQSGISVETGTYALPCTRAEALRVLPDVFQDALNAIGTRHISLYVSYQPDVWHLFIAAERCWPLPLNEVIAIGKADQHCERSSYVGWPDGLNASWFDNGHGRIYQIRGVRRLQAAG
jgi:hypothetical protein